jgi:trehalose 6-phosphate phosphatase
MSPAQEIAGADLPPPPTPGPPRLALFADLDGTLAPLEIAPDAVVPRASLTRLLEKLSERLEGRLAVVSGRSLPEVDRIVEGVVTPVGAVHGLVRRLAGGEVWEATDAGRVPEAVAAFRALQQAETGLLVEDKGSATALHFRRSPGAAEACAELAGRLAATLGLNIQAGDHVVELRAPGPDKGDTVRAFMAEPPFRGAVPVFIGDDLTDEAGFAAAAELGGWGVIVGSRRPTRARYGLADVDGALAWLSELAAAP